MQKATMSCFRVCAVLLVGIALFSMQSVSAIASEEVKLVAPQKTVGKPVMEALNLRQSNRNFSVQALSDQDLSNLLWSAFGANRTDGRRTVPTARNKQDLAVYIVIKTGIWKYDGIKHSLTLAKAGDVTSKFGSPATMVYVAPKDSADVSGMHVGSVYQNVALYCASANLSNVVKTSVRNALDGYFAFPDGYKVFAVQLVGIPAK